MSVKRILEQLKKEKDPLKYLEKELKKTEDKKLRKEIEKLIEKEKLKNKEERKEKGANEEGIKTRIPSLEQIAASIPRTRAAPTETLENYQSRTRARVMVPGLPSQEGAQKQGSYSENYGSNVKSDYITTKGDFNRQLEVSGLTMRTGFTTTAESKHAIQQKAGGREEYMEARDNLNIEQYSVRGEMIKEDLIGLSPDLKQAKRGRRDIEIYHG